MDHTHQMETDTAAEEREVIIQRGVAAISSGDKHQITAARDQLRQYREMYQGDPALAFVDENLRSLDKALGEESPDEYAFKENDPQ